MKAPDIVMGGALDAMVKRLMESGPAIRREMESSTKSIAKNAAFMWPVSKSTRKTHSRDAIETGAGISGDSVVTFVQIDVSYVYYIKSWQNGLRGQSPWQELLRKPGIAEGKRLGAVLAEDLAEIAGGRRG
jgi:hypothetical protein